ncbi:hypothetical protein [Desulfosediminicola sp.]
MVEWSFEIFCRLGSRRLAPRAITRENEGSSAANCRAGTERYSPGPTCL